MTRSRREAAIYLLAHLVIFAYVFQVMAVDHWSAAPAGAASTAFHETHCHGSAPGCTGFADTGSSLHVEVSPLIPPEAAPGELDLALLVPDGETPLESDPPPRKAHT